MPFYSYDRFPYDVREIGAHGEIPVMKTPK